MLKIFLQYSNYLCVINLIVMNHFKNQCFISFLLLIFACQNKATPEVYYYKSTEKSRQNAPFSDAVQVGNLFFLTGQIGKNHKTGTLVQGGITAETKQAFLNIEAVLKQHQLELKNIVKCTVILATMEDFALMNEVYRTFFMVNLPARTTFAANLVGGAKIEIEVVAAKQ